jgi:hypothetical protein
LAWRSADDDVDVAFLDLPVLMLREVSIVWDGGVVMSQHGVGKRLDLAESNGIETEWFPSNRGRFNPAAYAQVVHVVLDFTGCKPRVGRDARPLYELVQSDDVVLQRHEERCLVVSKPVLDSQSIHEWQHVRDDAKFALIMEFV